MTVIIGMDPHERSATIEAVDDRGRILMKARYATDTAGYADMLAAGRQFPDRVWAIEGCNATQLKWFQINGELPTVKAAISDPALTADPNVAVYAKQLQDAKLLPVLPAWDKASTKMLDAVNAVVLKGADQNATLTKLNDDVAALQK